MVCTRRQSDRTEAELEDVRRCKKMSISSKKLWAYLWDAWSGAQKEFLKLQGNWSRWNRIPPSPSNKQGSSREPEEGEWKELSWSLKGPWERVRETWCVLNGEALHRGAVWSWRGDSHHVASISAATRRPGHCWWRELAAFGSEPGSGKGTERDRKQLLGPTCLGSNKRCIQFCWVTLRRIVVYRGT